MRRLVLIAATLFGILVMHGGVGTSACSEPAMDGGVVAMTGGDMAAHHMPAAPQQPAQDHQQAGCLAVPPSTATAAQQRQHDRGNAAASTAVQLTVVLQLAGPTGREPPRSRQLDPTDGLGVLRI